MALITGTPGNDPLDGTPSDDTIYGYDGADTLTGEGGNDTLIGGNGEDVYWVKDAGDLVVEASTPDWDTVWTEISYTLTANVEELDLLGSSNINGTGNSGDNFLYGNSGNNYLDGGAGNDTIYGNDGNDTLVGSAGTDSLIGGNGADTYWVKDAGDIVVEGAGTDWDIVWSDISYTLTANVEELDLLGSANLNGTGNASDNWIFGNSGNNLLTGLDGADTLVSNGGVDTLVGGNGEDTYWVTNTTTVVTETNAVDWDAVWSEVSYTLGANLEELDLLGSANLNATGNSGINFLYGNSGNNVLDGLAGNDTIYGNAGNDTLQGGGGADSLFGGAGDDYYYVDNAGDAVSEETSPGIDDGGYDHVAASITYTLGAHVEELDQIGSANINGTGNALDNYIYGNSGNNLLSGLAGNDTIQATAGGLDTLVGGTGEDTYWINSASTVITETNTTDWDAVWSEVTYTLPTNVEELDLLGSANINATGNSGVNFLYGNSGNNVLDGLAGNDTIYGNAGNDTLQGGGGADSLFGGAGDDYYYVDNAGDAVSEETSPGIDDGGYDHVASSITYTLGAHIEELDQIGSANINGTGNALDNYIYGNSGNNLLSGLAGNDTIQSTSGGLDTLVGGDGEDTYWISSASTVILETNTTDWDAVWSSVSYTLPTNVEELDLLGSANINATGNSGVNFLYGNSGNNYLNGLAGNDTLIGNAGNDTLQGGGGGDTMFGGAGDDYYYVDNVGDSIYEETTPGIDDGGYDKVAASISYTLAKHVEELDLLGTSNINGTGNADDNWIFGNSGNNLLTGLNGNDTLVSNGGLDTLVGGNGEDTYWITSASTVITETNVTDWDAVWSSASYTLATNLEELDLLGGANINATGNTSDNFLYGNTGANILSGLDGNDTLIGNAGNDTLNGGNGADSFVFAAAGAANGLDNVQDFVHGTDQLWFTGADYGFSAGHSLTASEFTVGSSASGASAQFIWDAATHTLYFDDDGTGSHAAIAIATFSGSPTVDASDLHFG